MGCRKRSCGAGLSATGRSGSSVELGYGAWPAVVSAALPSPTADCPPPTSFPSPLPTADRRPPTADFRQQLGVAGFAEEVAHVEVAFAPGFVGGLGELPVVEARTEPAGHGLGVPGAFKPHGKTSQ